jgi:AAA family ATP:ADP antiporter
MTASRRKKSLLEKVLNLFADVEPGEGVQVVLMFVNIFLILGAYYVLKVVREGLVLTDDFFGLTGAQAKAVSSAVLAGILVVIVPLYARLGSRFGRLKLLNVSLVFVIASLLIFFVLGRAGVPIGVAFFLWLGVVNVFLIAQFWSYANDVYSERQGKRLFAIIGIGASVGAILGPKVVELFEAYTYALMIAAAGVFAASIVLYRLIDGLATAGDGSGAADPKSAALAEGGAFSLVLRSRYLLLIAVMMMLANLVNTTGEFILSATAEAQAEAEVTEADFADVADPKERATLLKDARRAAVNEFFGSFFFWVNLISFLIQAFLVSRIFKFLGVRVALFALPLIALGGNLAIGLIGGVALIRVAKMAENATDYSLQNTVRHALFLPTSREEKYKAKAAIDTFFVRGGDALSAAVVLISTLAIGLAPRSIAFVSVAVVALWLIVVAFIGRGYNRLSSDGEAGDEEDS